MDPKGQEKKERLLAALEKGMVMVHLDARRPGVLVPQPLREEAHLRLNISYRFDPPDLSVGEWGVRSTLSFSGSRFTVAIPWSALFAITSHVSKEFWMYPDDMPPELIQSGPAAATPAPSSAKGALREVTGEGREVETRSEEEPPKPRGRAHLRVVK